MITTPRHGAIPRRSLLARHVMDPSHPRPIDDDILPYPFFSEAARQVAACYDQPALDHHGISRELRKCRGLCPGVRPPRANSAAPRVAPQGQVGISINVALRSRSAGCGTS